MKYIASCSFGKDSLAAIETRYSHGEQIDAVVYCRIMFDHKISAEYPEHEDWIHTYAIPLLKSRYGLETEIVQSDISYVQQFYSKYLSGKRKGEIYGFPILQGPWCNSRLKIAPIKAWQKQAGEYTQIIGIAADEPLRADKKTSSDAILPLVQYGITEAQALEICKKADLLSPAYSKGRQRLGCWFCHNQRIPELRRLRKESPHLWKRLLDMETESPMTFRPRETLLEFEERFGNEDAQLTLWDYSEKSRSCSCETPCGHYGDNIF